MTGQCECTVVRVVAGGLQTQLLLPKLGEVQLLGPIFIDASLLLHLGCALLTETDLLIEPLPILCSALLFSLLTLALHSGW